MLKIYSYDGRCLSSVIVAANSQQEALEMIIKDCKDLYNEVPTIGELEELLVVPGVIYANYGDI